MGTCSHIMNIYSPGFQTCLANCKARPCRRLAKKNDKKKDSPKRKLANCSGPKCYNTCSHIMNIYSAGFQTCLANCKARPCRRLAKKNDKTKTVQRESSQIAL